MAFEVLETKPRDSRIPMASVSYERPKGKGARLPRLIVALPTVLAGLCKRERFRFEVGSGTDAGKARISGLAKGVPGASAPGTMMKHCLVIRFGEVAGLGEDAAAREACAIRKIDDNTWEIELPAWFQVEPYRLKQGKARAA